MKKGIVKFYNPSKGWGFIKYDGGKEIFVHHTGIEGDELTEGAEVEFEIENGKKGLNAINVRIIGN